MSGSGILFFSRRITREFSRFSTDLLSRSLTWNFPLLVNERDKNGPFSVHSA